jgi:hypothetical protein
MSLFDVSEHAERLHKRAIARQELRKYPTGARPRACNPRRKVSMA